MWVWLAVASSALLGFYDVGKKYCLRRNGVLYVLLGITLFSVLFLCPFLSAGTGREHLILIFKALLVTISWVSGLSGIKYLPLTTATTLKASRPVLVVVLSMLLFGERLGIMQWCGVVLVFAAIFMLGRTSRKEGISFVHNKGVLFMLFSILSGAASALWDKHLISGMAPLFIQSWTNVYISALLLLLIAGKALFAREKPEPFHFDWMMPLTAVIITLSDALYFYSLSGEGALLSVITLVRRASIIVTFVLGAILFKEHRIRDKAAVLSILLAGLVLLVLGSA
ncbi:MAG: EamA family transporter [Bacteroidales bacterium]|nr:EamA family transporter [Bacteroidales bacterium]